MFGVSGLCVHQLQRRCASRSVLLLSYTAWSVIWIAAHALGGALIGALLGFAGSLIPLSRPLSLWILLAVVLVGGLHQLGLLRLPMPQLHRQVARQWMKWPPALTAVGYGVQLGSGISTRITNFSTYAALICALLARSPGRGAIAMIAFGVFRALPAVCTGPFAYTPERSFHLAFCVGAWEPRIHKWSGILLLLYACLIGAGRDFYVFSNQ